MLLSTGIKRVSFGDDLGQRVGSIARSIQKGSGVRWIQSLQTLWGLSSLSSFQLDRFALYSGTGTVKVEK